jgi:hypothetical protein
MTMTPGRPLLYVLNGLCDFHVDLKIKLLPIKAEWGKYLNIQIREVLLKGKLSTLDLLVVTSLEQIILIKKVFFYLDIKQATLMRKSY